MEAAGPVKKNPVDDRSRIEPPYSLRFNKGTKKIEFKCTLHKVPPQFIEFEPTPTRLVLHTNKYSKHFYIDVPYPHNVTVAADDSTEAQLENGILSTTFDIISKVPEAQEPAQVLGKRKKNKKVEDAAQPPPKRKATPPKPKRNTRTPEKVKKKIQTPEKAKQSDDKVKGGKMEKKNKKTPSQKYLIR